MRIAIVDDISEERTLLRNRLESQVRGKMPFDPNIIISFFYHDDNKNDDKVIPLCHHIIVPIFFSNDQ